MKKYKVSLLICTIIWVLSFLIMTSPLKLPFVSNTYSETRLLVTGQAVTGPEIRVIKGSDSLKNAIPMPHPDDLNTGEIEMTGMSIYSWAEYPYYYQFDYVITGMVEGTTIMYQEAGSGTIPVFRVDSMMPVGTALAWIELKVGELTILAISILLWLLPIFIIGFCFRLKELKTEQKSDA